MEKLASTRCLVTCLTALVRAAPLLATIAAGSAIPAVALGADPGPTLMWQRYPSTLEIDLARGAAIDSFGDIIVGGVTGGSIGGPNEGDYDAFLVKYSPAGAVKWRRQPSSAREDRLNSVAVDAADNVIAVGRTHGALAGPHRGLYDAFVVKYAADGTQRWRRQFGTSDSDGAEAVATDVSGNIIVAGYIGSAAVVMKYGPDGTEQWRRLIEFANALGVATNAAGTVVVVGRAASFLAEPSDGRDDTFVAKYSADGTLQWIEQPGRSGEDAGLAVAVDDEDRIFVVGSIYGLSGGSGFLASFSEDGTELWRRHRGSDSFDGLWGVAIDLKGNVIVGGSALRQQFVASYTPAGEPQWTRKLPTYFDYKLTPATTLSGHLVISGSVWRGDRSFDGYLARYLLP